MTRYTVAALIAFVVAAAPVQAQLLQQLERSLMSGGQSQAMGQQRRMNSNRSSTNQNPPGFVGHVNMPSGQYMITNMQTGKQVYVNVQSGKMFVNANQTAPQTMAPAQTSVMSQPQGYYAPTGQFVMQAPPPNVQFAQQPITGQ